MKVRRFSFWGNAAHLFIAVSLLPLLHDGSAGRFVFKNYFMESGGVDRIVDKPFEIDFPTASRICGPSIIACGDPAEWELFLNNKRRRYDAERGSFTARLENMRTRAQILGPLSSRPPASGELRQKIAVIDKYNKAEQLTQDYK